jgi:hypothetical protein
LMTYAPTTEGRPAEDVATTVVGFPPIVHSPVHPSHPPRHCIHCCCHIHCHHGCPQTGTPHRIPHGPPPLPPCHCPRSNASANPRRSLNMYNPGPCAGCRSRGQPYCCQSRSNICLSWYCSAAIVVIVVIIVCPLPPHPPPCHHCPRIVIVVGPRRATGLKKWKLSHFS